MTTPTRRERQRAERHRLIVDTAHEIAETQGWDAVTVRRLAEAIEYSQPVLYSHFAGRDAIVAAVAEQGFPVLNTATAILARRRLQWCAWSMRWWSERVRTGSPRR